jgi:hypothetical protein
MNREEEPNTAIIKSQSIETSPAPSIERDFNVEKKWDHKRHLLVDTQELSWR